MEGKIVLTALITSEVETSRCHLWLRSVALSMGRIFGSPMLLSLETWRTPHCMLPGVSMKMKSSGFPVLKRSAMLK